MNSGVILVINDTKTLLLFTVVTIFLSFSSHIYACNINEIKIAHVSFLEEIGLPKNSLLSISKGKISVISDRPLKNELKLHGSKKITLYEIQNGKLILKGIKQTNLNPTLINFLNKSITFSLYRFIISKDGIFIVNDGTKKDPNYKDCEEKLIYFNQQSRKYSYHTAKSEIEHNGNNEFNEISFLSELLNSDYNDPKLENIITLKLQDHQNSKDLINKINKKRQANTAASTIIIKPARSGLQLSEIHVPISAYARAYKFKDENELFYSSSFITSKNPKLIKSKSRINFDLGWKNKNNFLKIDSDFGISKSLNSHLEIEYQNSNLNISKLHISYREFSRKHLLTSGNLGKFSKKNTGLLLNIQKLNAKKESSMNTAAYLNLNSNCGECIKMGVLIGFEKYNRILKGYTTTNFFFQNLKTKTEKIIEMSFTKRLNNSKQLTVSSDYEFNTKSPSISMKIKFPFNSNKNFSTVSYASKEKELISNWTAKVNHPLLDNTPMSLKRNWRDYINFNQTF